MIHVVAKVTPEQWRALAKWSSTFKTNMRAAMWKALNQLHTRLRLNLSGPSHTLFPGNSNPFPGVVTGRLRNSISSNVTTTGRDFIGITGPDVWYARPVGLKYPYLVPSFEAERDDVNRILQEAITESITP